MDILPEHFKQLERQFVDDLWNDFRIKTDYKDILKRKDSNEYNGGFRKDTIEKFIDNGGIYTYRVYISDEIQKGRTHVIVETENERECVTIYIENRHAVLHNMSYEEGCAKEGLRRPGGGNKLLRFALNLILKYKDEYKIKRILLTDKSFIICEGKSETIKLAQLRLITHGEPWYCSYGFKLYDGAKQKPSKDLEKSIKESNDILKTMKTISINIGDIIGKAITKEKITNYDVKELTRLTDEYSLMRDFVNRLVREYNKYCYILIHLLKELYRPAAKTGLTDFYKKSFYLDI